MRHRRPSRVELFDPGSVFAHEVVRTIDLTRELPLPGENPPVVLLPGPFAAADFDELTLGLAEMPRGQMVASWEGSAGSDGSDRSAGSDTEAGTGRPILSKLLRQAEHAAVLADEPLRFSFPLADVAEWRGRIERLLVRTGARHRFHIRPLRVEVGPSRRVSRGPRPGSPPPGWSRSGPTTGRHCSLQRGRRERPDRSRARRHPPGALPRAQPGQPAVGRGAHRRRPGRQRYRRPRNLARHPGRRNRALAGAAPRSRAAATCRRPAAGVEVDGPAGALVYLADLVFLAPVRRQAPNLVLISIDTLRADHLSLYGYDRRTSPGLDAWARDAVVFRRAVVSATTTLPSHTSLFTGLESIRHGVHLQPAPPG